MRRLVAIPIKSGLAVGLWTLAALTVAADVRQPGFWSEKIDEFKRSGDRVIGRSGNPTTQANRIQFLKSSETEQTSVPVSPEPAYQTNNVAAGDPASQTPETSTNAKDPHTRLIVISIPDRKLALLEDGVLVKAYPVAVGAKGSPSPEGEYTIINHAVNPTYRHDDVEIAPGKDNPLGTRWMGLSLKGYGIHGTNVQRSVGKAVSHGCFRMKKKDVEELYAQVKVGDMVSIHGQRDDLTAQLFEAAPAVEVASANINMPAPKTKSGKTETELASTGTSAPATGDEP